jgi:predicted ATPase/DNA-binding winged helix-turn-helix (wHTH) protein
LGPTERLVSGLPEPTIYAYNRWELDQQRRELRAEGQLVRIGQRAFAILATLVTSANSIVTKDELVRKIWARSIIGENTLNVHISAIRRALADDRDLLKTIPGRGYRLVGDWVPSARGVERSQPTYSARTYADGTSASNLPAAWTRLIGRDIAIQRVCDLLGAYRVVTLTGVGGIGKTSLALEVARVAFPDFAGDVWFVELVGLSDPALVPSAIGATLGIEVGATDPSPETIARAIGSNRTLILLDNCEHVIDTAADTVETITRLCSQVSILTTSREILRIDGECVYQVQPLDVPSDEAPVATDFRHGAVELFLTRQQSLDETQRQPPEDLRKVAAICRRLDGIPLAIELAAARATTLGVDHVLAHLDERFKLLTEGRRTAQPKHKTLRATLDWSYELLPEREQRLFRLLALFPAGFTLEAAVAILPEVDDRTVIELVDHLIAKSLIVLDRTERASRWRMLETTRAYALDRLIESGEWNAACARQCTFFCDLVASASAGSPNAGDLARFGREVDNVRAALAWAFSKNGDPRLGISLTAGYAAVWLHLFLILECIERVEEAQHRLASIAESDARTATDLQITLGFAMLNTSGQADKTAAVITQGLAMAERQGDLEPKFRAIWTVWSVNLNCGQYRKSRDAAARFLELAKAHGDRPRELIGYRLLGSATHFMGRQSEARLSLEQSLGSATRAEESSRPIWYLLDQQIVARAMLARVLLLQGHLTEARHLAEANLEDARATEHKLSVCYALRNALCPILLMLGDIAAAEHSVAILMDLVTRHGMTFWRGWGACLHGQVLIKKGHFEDGLALLRSGVDMRIRAGWIMRVPEFLCSMAEAYLGLGKPGDAVATLDDALARSEDGEQMWYVAEILRLRALAALQRGDNDARSAALTDLRAAFDLSERQGAAFLRSRCASQLAQL